MSQAPMYTMLIEWDRLLGFLRRACSSVDSNGDFGDELSTTLEVLKRDDLVETFARRLFELDSSFKAKSEPLRQQLHELERQHWEQERALAAELQAEIRDRRSFEQWLGIEAKSIPIANIISDRRNSR